MQTLRVPRCKMIRQVSLPARLVGYMSVATTFLTVCICYASQEHVARTLIQAVADPGVNFGRGTWRARERGLIMGVWGGAPRGVTGPPEAESLSAFRRPVEVAELPHSAYFAKSINQA